MRKLYVLFALCSFSIGLSAQGIEFFDGHFKDAFQAASEQDKLVFVDAYAVWCGPCKRMAKQVFPKEEVGEFFNTNFINLKIDMEKGQGLDFRKDYPVSAFPTFFFIDGQGKVIHKYKGGRDIAGFIAEAKKALANFDNTEKYVALYEDGDRSYETVYKYIKALNRSGKSSLKVANDYVKTQKDLSTEENVRLLFEAATETDSRIFDLLIGQKSKAINYFGQEAFEDKVLAAATKTFNKSLEFDSKDLEKEAFAAVKKHAKSRAKAFQLECDLEKARINRDAKTYVASASKYHKQVISNQEPQEIALVETLLKMFDKDPSALNLASKIATNVATNNTNTSNCLLACNTFIRLNQISDAKLWAEKAMNAAGSNKRDQYKAQQQLKQLESR